jgi:phosphatidylglycerol lysyltransferase
MPAISLMIFVAGVASLHRELAHFRLSSMLWSLHAISGVAVWSAIGCTLLSYWLLGFYDVLALRYVGKTLSYARTALTAFIAYAFAHNFGLAIFTGGAVRYRLYSSAGLSGSEVATVSAFCAVTSGLGLAALAGLSFLFAPHAGARALPMNHEVGLGLGAGLILLVALYGLAALMGNGRLELLGWSLRIPPPSLALSQITVAVTDLTTAASVLWLLLPAAPPIPLLSFLGAYAIAMAAGTLSYVPSGLGVFESLLIATLPTLPADQLIGSILVWRAIYFLLPLLLAALLFGTQELRGGKGLLSWIERRASPYVAPLVPQMSGALVLLAGFSLLVTGATPALNQRLAILQGALPLGLLEISHLAGSVIGLALIIVARALFRRVAAAYRLTQWLLGAGMVAALLRGLEVEQALALAGILGILWLGRRAFYRPATILAQRFTPAWIASITVLIGTAVWIGFFAHRHVEYSNALWWTFAFEGNAPRMLRASLTVALLATAFITANLLRPAPPEAAVASPEDLGCARALIQSAPQALANAALMGDKRLLFSPAGDAFLMYQIYRRSWIALGEAIGARQSFEELLWQYRELSDRHGGWTVFYQISAERLPLFLDLGLAITKIGEEARVALDDFSLEGSARAELRTQRRRAERDGATFEVLPPEFLPPLLPKLRAISDSWLLEKAAGEKRFSVGAFSEAYVSQFPTAVVRADAEPVAFATLWTGGTGEEIAVDLMRFGPDAPRGAMDFLFVELMLWAKARRYRWVNLGMAPLAGLEQHPLAPIWHRAGNFVFRHGEHFYNFEGLRRYKAKFHPEWTPKYLACPGGLALPRVLLDVSLLIAGGVKELVAR